MCIRDRVCFETFGIILIEAFKQGTPVVARRIGPFPEIVAASGGAELFATPEELRSILVRLQAEPAERDALARACYRGFLTNWTERAVIPRYLAIVRRAAERKAAAEHSSR